MRFQAELIPLSEERARARRLPLLRKPSCSRPLPRLRSRAIRVIRGSPLAGGVLLPAFLHRRLLCDQVQRNIEIEHVIVFARAFFDGDVLRVLRCSVTSRRSKESLVQQDAAKYSPFEADSNV